MMISLHSKNNSARTYRFNVTPCITGELLAAPDPHIVNKLLPQHLRYADVDLFSNRRRPIKMLIGNDECNTKPNPFIEICVTKSPLWVDSFEKTPRETTVL